ncbi:ZIP family metal transporter [Nanoarchaeota archaeon]
MDVLLWILLATIVNSLIGLIGALTLFIKEKAMKVFLPGLIAFSGGALLGGAFFHLLSESLEILPSMNVFICAIIGFALFLILESYLHWHHCESCHHPYTRMMLIGDSVHNFIDGLVIAASFLVSPILGIVTTLMVLGHEAPQELGLFGVLLHGKYKKKKALLLSFIVQAICILGGLVGYFASTIIQPLSTFLIPFAAGGFIYIAAADLVPEMHKLYEGKFKTSLYVIFSFLVGIALMLGIKLIAG